MLSDHKEKTRELAMITLYQRVPPKLFKRAEDTIRGAAADGQYFCRIKDIKNSTDAGNLGHLLEFLGYTVDFVHTHSAPDICVYWRT